MNFLGKLFIFTVFSIFRIGQAAEHLNVDRLWTFQQRHLKGSGGSGSGGGNIDGSISIGGNAGIDGKGEIIGESPGEGSGTGGMLGGKLGSPTGGSGEIGGVDLGAHIGVNGQTNSFSQVLYGPLQFLNTISGFVSGITEGALGALSSPLTLSNSFFESLGLEYSPIVGPVSGTLFAGIEAIRDSPETIHASLAIGLEDIVDGITGILTSPESICNEILEDGIRAVLASPLRATSILSFNIGDFESGILRAVSSPLTIIGQVLDAGVDLTLNSAGGTLLPESLDLALPGSISRGIEAFITSSPAFKVALDYGLKLTENGLLGLLFSPWQLSSAIMARELSLHTESPLIFPEESNNPIYEILDGFLVWPLYAIHALSAQSGVTLSGILTLLSSVLMVSGDNLDVILNTNISSPNIPPDESTFGLPTSIIQSINAFKESPMTLSSIISDSAHLFVEGVPGLITSPITVLCSYSPFAFPGSENIGPAGILDSPLDLSELLSNNVAYTLAGLLGFLSSPVTLSAELLRASVNWNVDSLNVLPEQLAFWGIPESIGSSIASFLEVPFQGLLNILGFFSSPLSFLDGIGIANVPGSPNSPKIFPPDFPTDLPDEITPTYVDNPPCTPALSGSSTASK